MSLRARMGLVAGVAVALAVVAVAISAYLGTRSELRGETDQSLSNIASQYVHASGWRSRGDNAGPFGPPGGGAPTGVGASAGALAGGVGASAAASGFSVTRDCDRGLGINGPPDQAFGGAPGFVQLVTPGGSGLSRHDGDARDPSERAGGGDRQQRPRRI